MSQAVPRQPATLVANSSRTYEVEQADLPLSCPMPQTGSAKCPYCGAEFTLRR
jgi:uncharacterized Zn-finger protein